MAAARSAAAALALALVAVALVASAPAGAAAQQVPGILQCAQSAQNVGEDNLLIRLAPCASGTNAACCDSAKGLLQLGGGGELAGCLCQSLVLEQTLSRVESNQLAKNFGVSRDSVMAILRDCKIKYAGGEGESACPSSMGLKHGGWDKHGSGSSGDANANDSSGNDKHGDWGKHGRRMF
jgi:hypothetical protein